MAVGSILAKAWKCLVSENCPSGPQRNDAVDAKFFKSCWTAKEAVLKGEQIGMLGIKKCFVNKIIDNFRMIVSYKNRLWYVKHICFDNHIIAIASKSIKIN